MDVFQDELPSVSISPAAGDWGYHGGNGRGRRSPSLALKLRSVCSWLGSRTGAVGVSALCLHCGLRSRVLKLFDGCVLCWRCCHRRGASYRVRRGSLKRGAEFRIPRLLAMLESKTSLRLKPVLRGTMERRKRHCRRCFSQERVRYYQPRSSLSRCAETDAGDGNTARAHRQAKN